MPKTVDHVERRGELGQAVWRVIRRGGLAGASVRTVAAEAGWSPGSLRHYFASQSELLAFAMSLVGDRVVNRVNRLDLTGPPIESSLRLLEELLPLDEERILEMEVWTAFTAASLVDPALHELRTRSHDGLRAACRLVVQAVRAGQPVAAVAGSSAWLTQDAGDGHQGGWSTRPRSDSPPVGQGSESDTGLLHAVLDGLALHAVTRPDVMTPLAIRTQLAAYVRTLADRDDRPDA